jgi:hypothetical protein
LKYKGIDMSYYDNEEVETRPAKTAAIIGWRKGSRTSLVIPVPSIAYTEEINGVVAIHLLNGEIVQLEPAKWLPFTDYQKSLDFNPETVEWRTEGTDGYSLGPGLLYPKQATDDLRTERAADATQSQRSNAERAAHVSDPQPTS